MGNGATTYRLRHLLTGWGTTTLASITNHRRCRCRLRHLDFPMSSVAGWRAVAIVGSMSRGHRLHCPHHLRRLCIREAEGARWTQTWDIIDECI